MSDNPLLKYHTQPGTFIRLPSGGKFYQHPPTLTADGDIEIRPMNAIDELNFQNPDSLLNNEALFSVFKNCVPGITNPREILKPDLDALLLGLRIATYGETMEVVAKCPNCGHESTLAVDLSQIAARAKPISGETQIEIEGLKVNIKPFTVDSQQKLSEVLVNIQRLARDLDRRAKQDATEAELIETLQKELSGQMQTSAREIFEIAAKSIVSVETDEDGVIEDAAQIREWLSAIRAPDYKKIKNAAQALSEETIDRVMTYNCEECNKSSKVEVQFDPANFFVSN